MESNKSEDEEEVKRYNVESESARIGRSIELQRQQLLRLAAARSSIHPSVGFSAVTGGVLPYQSRLETLERPMYSDAARISRHQHLTDSHHLHVPGFSSFATESAPNRTSADLQSMVDLQSIAGLSRQSYPNGTYNPFYGVNSAHEEQNLLRRACQANEELRRFAWSPRSPEGGGFLPHDVARLREYSPAMHATNQSLAAGYERRQWAENSRLSQLARASSQDSIPRRLMRNDSHEGSLRQDGKGRLEGSDRRDSSVTEESEGGETQQSSDNVADQLKQIPKPSRPLTAYNIFFKDQRLVLLEEASANSEGKKSTINSRKNQSTGIPFTLMGKKIGSKWQKLSAEEKRRYVEKADEDKVRHKIEMKEYNRKREILMSSYHEKQMSSVDDSVLSRYYANHGDKRSLERREIRLGKSKRRRKDNSDVRKPPPPKRPPPSI